MLIRPAVSADRDFLGRMLFEAAFWRPADARPPLLEAIAHPQIVRYIDGWMRPDDAGVIATEEPTAIGAVWYRVFDPAEPGYGFAAPDIPELTVAVLPEWRGRGVGTALLHALIARARIEGRLALSLSVERDNPARRLYRRLGFVPCGELEGSWTMLLDLKVSPRGPGGRKPSAVT